MTVLTGKQITDKEIVSPYKLDSIQPCGYDLHVRNVSCCKYDRLPTISVNSFDRVINDWQEIKLFSQSIYLPKGQYKIEFAEEIAIPNDCMGLIFPRSSLLRSDCTITTAVWDAGYHGTGFGYLIVNNPLGLRIEQYAAVAQLVVMRLDMSPETTYSGTYQHEGIKSEK